MSIRRFFSRTVPDGRHDACHLRFLARETHSRHDRSIEILQADRVLIARGVLADSSCRARLDAMMARVDCPDVQAVDDDALESALCALGPRQGRARGGLDGRGRPKALVAFARLGGGEREVFPGYSWRELRDGGAQAGQGVLCQTAVEVQSAVGCPFDCAYCPYTSFVCVRLDVDAIVERIAGLVTSRPHQTLWKLNNRSDTLGLEPEYGLARALVERFARLPGDHTLMLYSKGEAVDALLGLDHRRRTVASFTITPDAIAALLEQGAPPPSARIEALGKMHRAGYPTRVRFSPVVPLRGWRAQYEDLAARIARAGTPELVTLWTLSMIELDDLGRIVPLADLDDEILAEARAGAARTRGTKGAPFPDETRARIYRDVIGILHRVLPETRVSLCLESPVVWDALGALVPPRRGGSFVCNCGPRATPEAVRVLQAHTRLAKRV
jgi:spore photoproduct lyase-like protein